MLALIGLIALLLAGCAEPPPASEATEPSGELTIFAAASLTDAFAAVTEAFTDRHPKVEVRQNLAGSQRLAGQLLAGAEAAVFASADSVQMAVVTEAGLVAGGPVTFATNALAIAVELGNPREVTRLADLTAPDVLLIMAAEDVPAGRYARAALASAGVDVNPASLEPDVRAVLAKVALGEADAGIVFTSDLVAAGERVEGVAIPTEHNVTATYEIATLDDARDAAAARAFIEFVRSDTGQQILVDHGFGLP